MDDFPFDATQVIDGPEALRALYGEPSQRSLVKETDHLHPVYRAFVEAAPFVVVASIGPNGIDTSPRGDAPGFVHVAHDRRLMLPDRRGNNRVDTLSNIASDPRVALLFLIPGVGETLRVTGTARIVVDPTLCERFVVQGKLPRSVLVIDIERVFFQCQKALARSRLWSQEAQPPRDSLPSAGEMLKAFDTAFDAQTYDQGYPEHMRKTIY